MTFQQKLLYKLCMPNQRYMTARKFLLDELMLRQKKNPAYSQRAFARDLNILPSRLSEIMGGKVGISYVNATKIAKKLSLSPEENDIFLDLVSSEFGRSSAIRMAAASRLKNFRQGGYRVRTDEAHLISDWYYFALLGLIELEDFECNISYIAKRLGISEQQSQEALDQLIRMRVIEIKDGKAVRPGHSQSFLEDEVPSPSIQKSLRQILQKAEESLENRPCGERKHLHFMFSMRKSQIERFKQFLEELQREIGLELDTFESEEGKDAVFCLAMQYFEITEPK